MLKRLLSDSGLGLLADIMAQPSPQRFQIGDVIEFVKSDGWKWTVTILGREESGEFQMMFYPGKPLFFMATEGELAALRIVRVDTMKEDTLSMYRCEAGLEEWPVEVAA